MALGHRQIGRFMISNTTINRDPERALKILQGCLVVRAEQMWHADGIEYTALHADFDHVPLDQTIPTYIAQIHTHSGGELWYRQWVKVGGNQ